MAKNHDNSVYYVVNQSRYRNKLEAFTVAFSQGHWPHWYFYEDEFSSVDWQTEPSQDIVSLYRQRAQQIREQYDYIIVWFSGGSDSDNVVRSFLDQGLHIDEICHKTSIDIHRRRDSGTDSENTSMETLLAVKPRLEEYQNRYPWWKPKIKINNMFEYAAKRWAQNGKDAFTTNYYNFWVTGKEYSLDFLQHKKKNQRIANVYGQDKPKIVHNENKFYLTFMDHCHNANDMISQDLEDQTDHIWFYWHPESSDILRKQAHMIVRYLKNNTHYTRLFDFNHKTDITFYNNLIKKIIYPFWNINWWQQDKPKSDILHDEIYQFLRNSSHPGIENYFAMLQQYSNEVSRIYQNKQGDDRNYTTYHGINSLPSCYSKWYYISQ